MIPPAHDWTTSSGITFCRTCTIVQRADGKNKPCRGSVGISLRVIRAPRDPLREATTRAEPDADGMYRYRVVPADTEPRPAGCACHIEAGDSPCPVHGDDDR